MSLQAQTIHNGDASPVAEIVALGTGTTYKFKGLAIDVARQVAYLGSWNRKEIVTVSLAEKKFDVLKTPYNGKLNGMDCFLLDDKLYAVMNEVDDRAGAHPVSVLLILNARTGKLIRTYEAKAPTGRNHFNHLVVGRTGIAYITNTLKSSVQYVDTNNPLDSIKTLVVHPDLSWVHGIDLSPDEKKLFTTSYDGGIKFFDLDKMSFTPYRDVTLAGDDGLKFYNGYLYGVGRNSIKRYSLDADLSRVTRVDTLLRSHEVFNDARCLHIEGGWLYCLANIEHDPVVFEQPNAVSRKEPLNDSYIIKLKLPAIIKKESPVR
ncbi:MAG TPA: WD40 repeat domain-containing protein [Cyclobacteriaceae bacterium]|nr:WD40 repeat domain-containing protein [Cyclobacteriaceae bacterium]